MTFRTVEVGRHLFRVDDRGEGPAVVFIHGFTGDGSTMLDLAEQLDKNRRIIIPDLIGHGGSAAPEDPAPYDFNASAEQVFALVTELTSDPFDVIGYSMGGRLGLRMTVSHPDRVRSICVIGATPGISDQAERRARADTDADLADRIEADGVEAFVDFWERQPLFDSQTSLPEDLRHSVRNQRLSNTSTGLAMSLRGSGTGSMTPLHDDLARTQVPVCWITGELDTKFTEIANQVSDTNRLFESVIIPGAGHAAHIEQPTAVADAIASFWAGLDA